MTSLDDLLESLSAPLPAGLLARWASVCFSLFVVLILISLAAAQALLSLAAVLYAIHLLRGQQGIAFLPVKLPLLLFCLTTVVAVFFAADPRVGWLAVRKLVLFLILLLAINLVTSARHFQWLYKALFVESAIAGVVAVRQFLIQYREVRALHPGTIYEEMTSLRIHGFQGHWMNFGGQQMLVFVALLAFLLLAQRTRDSGSGLRRWRGAGAARPVPSERVPGRGARSAPRSSESRTPNPESRLFRTEPRIPNPESRLFCWLLLATVILSIILNFTRSVWLGCFVAAFYLVARWKPRWLWALPALAAASYLAAPSLVHRRIQILRHPSRDPALSIRFEMWRVGWRMIRSHPLVGVGPNNIAEVYPLYLPPGKSPEVGYHEHLHDNFIQLAAERGLPCLGAWLWFMIALAWHTWKIARQRVAPRWIAEGAVAGWLAFTVEGFFEFNFGTSPVLMLFLFIASTPFVIERIERDGLTR